MTSILCAPAATASDLMFRNACPIVTIEKRHRGDGLSLRLDGGRIAFGDFHLEAASLEVCRSLDKEQMDSEP